MLGNGNAWFLLVFVCLYAFLRSCVYVLSDFNGVENMKKLFLIFVSIITHDHTQIQVQHAHSHAYVFAMFLCRALTHRYSLLQCETFNERVMFAYLYDVERNWVVSFLVSLVDFFTRIPIKV